VNPTKIETEPQNHGEVLTAISDGLVALVKELH
jgi:hypothetical protein